jgi:hypothetical protein
MARLSLQVLSRFPASLNNEPQMIKKSELQFLSTIKTGNDLIKLVHTLRENRWEENEKRKKAKKIMKRQSLTKAQRQRILEKTDSRCHVCGIELGINDFHADHVKIYMLGGEHKENNYLPCCKACNRYRWHFSPGELQIIIKLGVWVKGRMIRNLELGLLIADGFVKHEMNVRKRCKAKNEK